MGVYYSDELIEEIRMSNDIVEVVSEYVKLERKGKRYIGLCPFHTEKTPSFNVVPSEQYCYCFGCQKGGNVIQFIMYVENLDYIEAVKFLADRAKISLPEEESDKEQKKAKLKQEILKANTEAARFFHKQLGEPENEKARRYLEERKIDSKTVRRFGLGYSTEKWDALYRYLLEKGFSQEVIQASGLVIKSKKGEFIDKFRGRIMFPIFDIRGNVIGFGGRVIDKSLPKYMNSPETLVYNKSKNLYALNFAKNSKKKEMLIVEGYMDVISLHQHGITNVVASLGTALTENQGRLLKKYCEEVIISYDSDAAGQAATLRGLDILDSIGCNVKILTIPDGKDPDEFVKKNGAQEFEILISKALPLIEYKLRVLKKQIDINTTDGKIRFLNEAARLLAGISNRVEQEMYVNKLSKEYNVSEESLYAEIYRRKKPAPQLKSIVRPTSGNNIINVKKAQATEDGNDKIIHCEKVLLALLCEDNRLYKVVKDKITPQFFTGDKSKELAKIVFDRLENGKSIEPAELLSSVDSETASEMTRIIMEECNCEDNVKAVLDIIKRIEIFRLDKRQKEILDILSSKHDQSEGDVEKLKQELKSILLMKQNI